jgi:hypothetical protein
MMRVCAPSHASRLSYRGNLAIQFWTGIWTLKRLQLWLMTNNLDTADSWLPMRAAVDWINISPDGSLYNLVVHDVAVLHGVLLS